MSHTDAGGVEKSVACGERVPLAPIQAGVPPGCAWLLLSRRTRLQQGYVRQPHD